MLLTLAVIFCAALSIDAQGKPGQKISVTVDTGWSIVGDRWVWGYADDLTPPNPSPDTPRVSDVQINSHGYRNKTEANNPPPITETSQPSPIQDLMIPTPPTPQISTNTGNTQKIENKTEAKTPSKPLSQKNRWAIYDEKLKEIIKNNATLANMIDDLCQYNPSLPDFNAPGRRISDVKCQEYIWNIKNDIEKQRRKLNCLHLKYKVTGDIRHIPTTVGGRSTVPGEFPHMGAIGWKGINGEWQFKCGSSLISPKFVLTAAHCSSARETDVTLADVTPKIVRLSHKNIVRGLPSKTLGEYDINILNIITHPEYKPPIQYYDVALIELESTVGFYQLVQPSCLWGYSEVDKLGAIATLTGWGVLAEGSLDISPELQAAVLDIIDSDKCTKYLRAWYNRNWSGVRDHQLCAGKLSGGVDACQGDSGGPLQVKIPLEVESSYNIYYVIGVTSFGVGCAQPNLPGVYTRVSSFIDWIESIVWPQ